MSYTDVPNILVDSLGLPNKPLSNLKIINAGKMLLISGVRGVFLRDTLSWKANKNECGYMNLDSSSGELTELTDFTENSLNSLSFMAHEDKKQFYFDSYEVQPPNNSNSI